MLDELEIVTIIDQNGAESRFTLLFTRHLPYYTRHKAPVSRLLFANNFGSTTQRARLTLEAARLDFMFDYFVDAPLGGQLNVDGVLLGVTVGQGGCCSLVYCKLYEEETFDESLSHCSFCKMLIELMSVAVLLIHLNLI